MIIAVDKIVFVFPVSTVLSWLVISDGSIFGVFGIDFVPDIPVFCCRNDILQTSF